tara:strand:+ start:77 stop:595 length:519 start_codon:yes stop_codon:yes gene_type:complete
MKILKLTNKYLANILICLFIIPLFFVPAKSFAEVAETEINGSLINASTEFLRDLDYETWQLVAYKSPNNNEKLVLRVIGYPGNLRIDHPLSLDVESGRKSWKLDDITLLNTDLVEDTRQAAAEFDLESLLQDISQNRPLRLSLQGVFSELPVPPFLVKEWRELELDLNNENK